MLCDRHAEIFLKDFLQAAVESIAACRAEGQYPSLSRIIKVDPGLAAVRQATAVNTRPSGVTSDKLGQMLRSRRPSGLNERIFLCLNCEILTPSWLS